MTAPAATKPREHRKAIRHPAPPKLSSERSGLNDRVANVIAATVGSMWMFYASIIGFAVWMAHSRRPERPGKRAGQQVEHLHQLGVTTHKLVVENTELTEAIHNHFLNNNAA